MIIDHSMSYAQAKSYAHTMSYAHDMINDQFMTALFIKFNVILSSGTTAEIHFPDLRSQPPIRAKFRTFQQNPLAQV